MEFFNFASVTLQWSFKVSICLCVCMCVSPTIHLLCPTTLSSDGPLGQCWAGPPGSPGWRSPGRTDAWRVRPLGSSCGRGLLHPSPTFLELCRNLPLWTPVPPHCWWSLWPCLWSLDPHHLRRGKWQSLSAWCVEVLLECVWVSLRTAIAGRYGGVTGLTLQSGWRAGWVLIISVITVKGAKLCPWAWKGWLVHIYT